MPDSPIPNPPSFESALARIEAIVHELEEGQTGLAESLGRYEEAVGLLGCKVRKDREVQEVAGRRRHPRREQWIELREVERSQGS